MSQPQVDQLWQEIKADVLANKPKDAVRHTQAMHALVRAGATLPVELQGMSFNEWKSTYPTIQVIHNKAVVVTMDNADLYKLSDYQIVWEHPEKGLFLLLSRDVVS